VQDETGHDAMMADDPMAVVLDVSASSCASKLHRRVVRHPGYQVAMLQCGAQASRRGVAFGCSMGAFLRPRQRTGLVNRAPQGRLDNSKHDHVNCLHSRIRQVSSMRRSIFQQPHLDLYRTILTMSQPFVAEFKLHIHTLTIYQYRQEFGNI
jgi:hypothetical protein